MKSWKMASINYFSWKFRVGIRNRKQLQIVQISRICNEEFHMPTLILVVTSARPTTDVRVNKDYSPIIKKSGDLRYITSLKEVQFLFLETALKGIKFCEKKWPYCTYSYSEVVHPFSVARMRSSSAEVWSCGSKVLTYGLEKLVRTPGGAFRVICDIFVIFILIARTNTEISQRNLVQIVSNCF